MKTQIKQTVAKLSALAFVFALLVGVMPSDAATDADEEVIINAEVLASLQLDVDSGSVLISVDPDLNSGSNMSGTTVSDSTTTTVSTNNQNGYALQIQLNGSTNTGSAVLDSTTIGTPATIGSQTGTTAIENNFGFALDNATIPAVAGFAPNPQAVSGAGTGNSVNTHNHTVYYYLNVDYTVPADTYAGTVTYTAVALP